MTKFHVNGDGDVYPCRAEVKPCPLGKDTPHFNSKEEAVKYSEEFLSASHNVFSSHNKKSLEREGRIKDLSSKYFPKEIPQRSQSEADQHIREMFEENKNMQKVLKDKGLKNDFGYYTFTGSRDMNGVLREGDANAYYSHPLAFRDDDEKRAAEKRIKERALQLNEVIKMVQNENISEPRVLYRYIKVPNGVTPEEFAKNIANGDKVIDKGFISTTEDPSFIHAQMFSRKNKKSKFIMLQMLTRKGVSMQTKDSESEGDLLSFEQERLLPIGVEFTIVNTVKKTIGTSEDRFELAKQFDPYGDEPLPNKRIVTLQLIDEDLLK